MNFVFNDGDAAVVRPVDDQPVGGLEIDALDIAKKLSHQLGAPPDNARPAEVVQHLVDDLIGEDSPMFLPSGIEARRIRAKALFDHW